MPANPNLGHACEDMALEILLLASGGHSHEDIKRAAGQLHQLVRVWNGSSRVGIALIRDGFVTSQVIREYGDVLHLFGPSPVTEVIEKGAA